MISGAYIERSNNVSYEPASWFGTISEKTVIPEACRKWEEENESELSKNYLKSTMM